jgi:hypothetical protein
MPHAAPALILILLTARSRPSISTATPALLAGMDAARHLAVALPARRRSLPSPSRPPCDPALSSDPAPALPTGDEDDGGDSDEVGRSFSGSEFSSSSFSGYEGHGGG